MAQHCGVLVKPLQRGSWRLAFVFVEVGKAVPKARVREAVVTMVVVKCMVSPWVDIRLGRRDDSYVKA